MKRLPVLIAIILSLLCAGDHIEHGNRFTLYRRAKKDIADDAKQILKQK